MNIIAALTQLAPGAEWTLRGDTLDGLNWLDATIARPSDAAIIAASSTAPLYAYAAEKRWQVETSGCVDPSGHRIATDRDSQSKMIAEMVAMQAGMRADPSPWKCADGAFVSFTNAQMQAAIMAARDHVQRAFAVEASARESIANGALTTTDQIDALKWPSA